MFNHLENLDYEIKISLEDEGLTFDQATKIACLTHQQPLPGIQPGLYLSG